MLVTHPSAAFVIQKLGKFFSYTVQGTWKRSFTRSNVRVYEERFLWYEEIVHHIPDYALVSLLNFPSFLNSAQCTWCGNYISCTLYGVRPAGLEAPLYTRGGHWLIALACHHLFRFHEQIVWTGRLVQSPLPSPGAIHPPGAILQALLSYKTRVMYCVIYVEGTRPCDKGFVFKDSKIKSYFFTCANSFQIPWLPF